MDIRIVSSLTAEDEARLVEALLKPAAVLLANWPVAFSIRVETVGHQIFQISDRDLRRDPAYAVSE